MAIGILGAMGIVTSADQHLLVGELSLDGTLRPGRGVLSIAACARRLGIANVIVPADNAAEAGVTEGIRVFGMRHLAEVVAYLREPDRFQLFAPPADGCLLISGMCAARRPPNALLRWPRLVTTTC
jgi:magnesium chelatase family protein